jgi:hypothetical protein
MIARREFLATLPALLIAPGLLKRREPPAVRIALVYAPEYANAARAAEMSANEVRRAATLLKREFEFTAISTEGGGPNDSNWTALIVAAPDGFISVETTTVNIGSAGCGPNTFTLLPASELIRGKRYALWHASLERFGASQLNDRFKAAHITIDDQAWLGWFAVKLLWEAGVRGKDPRALSYDGHKGMALRFNPSGILMQPLYVLSADGTAVVEEIRPDAAFEAATCGS